VIEARELASALDRLAIGVAVITTRSGEQPHGSTGMAWAEGAEPAKILTTLRGTGHTLCLVEECGRFGVNLLGRGQRMDAVRFAAVGSTAGRRFDGVAWHWGRKLGVPLLDEAIFVAECEVTAVHPFGAQQIVVGDIVSVDVNTAAADPLVHFGGRLGTFVDDGGHDVQR
jgi:flavin reductase (DIM6/NTAB) family NADH-FMN oxidoreductase RutF